MKLFDWLLGRKYYALIIDNFSNDLLSSNIYTSLEKARKARNWMLRNAQVSDIHITSFRTRQPLNIIEDKLHKELS